MRSSVRPSAGTSARPTPASSARFTSRSPSADRVNCARTVAMKLFLQAGLTLLAFSSFAQGPHRISDDRDLKLLDLAGWNCEQPGGTAKTADGVERNQMKNRPPI